jgi:hypothetical protein
MAKRSHFTDNDIEVFLTDTNWEKTFTKRIQDWKVAKFNGMHTFVQKLFNHVASYKRSDYSFIELLNKLDKAGYTFSPTEFLPAMMHSGSVSENFAQTYMQLFNFLESKGFQADKTMKLQLVQNFESTFHPILNEFLESKDIDVSWSNATRLIRGLRMKATSTFVEMGDFSKSPMGQLMLTQEARTMNKQFDSRLTTMMNEAQVQDDMELDFIMKYLNKAQLDKKQIKELEQNLLPPQMRLQQKLFEQNGSVDPFEMMQVGMEKKPKPRDWFNESQLKIIDLVEPKYGLKIIV